MTHELRVSDPQDSRGAGTDPRPSLTSANAVDGIVRSFTNEIVGLLGRDDFMAQLDFRSRALNNLFLGVTPSDRYERSGWNTPEMLGEFLLKSRHIDGATHLAVRDTLVVFVAALLDVVDLEAGFDGALIEPLIADLRDALLGLPSAD